MSAHAHNISIRDLSVDCIVGVYPGERTTPQPLIVEVDLMTSTLDAAATPRRREKLSSTIDYAFTAAQIAFVLEAAEFLLLETAADALATLLLAPPAAGEKRPGAERAFVKLTKPRALGGITRASVSVERQRTDIEIITEEKDFGTVDVVFETTDVGIYRLNVAPGRTIPLHAHHVMRESEMVLSPGVVCQDREAPVGTIFRWPRGALHRYDNKTTEWQTVLCIDSPPFVPSDEIATSGTPASIATDDRFVRKAKSKI